MEHQCDKALVIEQHAEQISELFEGRRKADKRLTEIGTILFGVDGNGGGFIRATNQKLDEIIDSQAEGAKATAELAAKVGKLTSRKRAAIELVKALAPYAILAVAVAVWIVTGKPPQVGTP